MCILVIKPCVIIFSSTDPLILLMKLRQLSKCVELQCDIILCMMDVGKQPCYPYGMALFCVFNFKVPSPPLCLGKYTKKIVKRKILGWCQQAFVWIKQVAFRYKCMGIQNSLEAGQMHLPMKRNLNWCHQLKPNLYLTKPNEADYRR